uniref:MATH domain-containing protein n=1 Tax=Panagrolaimus davidi TaxID=227884 RepID=A0A914Q195_9BILA
MDLVDKENDFALRNFDTECLNGKFYYAYNIPGLQYYLAIYPNGEDEEDRGESWACLIFYGSKERRISAEYTISVKSANFSKNVNKFFDDNDGWGSVLCKTEEFFDSKSKFFVNGEIIINVKGILKAKRPSTSVSIFFDLLIKDVRSFFKIR